MADNIFCYQDEMQKAFIKQLKKRCSESKDIGCSIDGKVGIENEYMVVDKELKPAPQAIRDYFINENPLWKRELGASQIEFNSLPISVETDHEKLLNHVKQQEETVAKQLEKYDCHILRMGFYPGNLSDIKITDISERYQSILDKYSMYRKEYFDCNLGGIDMGQHINAMIGGGQSSQLNLQVRQNDAIGLLNMIYELTPLFVALSSNSTIIDKKNSGYLEVRNVLWEDGYELRTYDEYIHNVSFRTHFPSDYYRNLEDYWKDVNRQLYMKYDTRHAFEINQKMFWRLARLKYQGRKLLLESRFMSIQPRCEEDIALHMFLYSLLLQKSIENNRLLPLMFVKENFRRATKYGTKASLYVYRENSNKIVEEDVKYIIEKKLHKVTKYWYKKNRSTGLFIEDIIYDKLIFGSAAEKQLKYLKKHTTKELMELYII